MADTTPLVAAHMRCPLLLCRPKAAAAPAAAADQEASPDPENVFYYDQELKMWRERGVDPPPVPEVRAGRGPGSGAAARCGSPSLAVEKALANAVAAMLRPI